MVKNKLNRLASRTSEKNKSKNEIKQLDMLSMGRLSINRSVSSLQYTNGGKETSKPLLVSGRYNSSNRLNIAEYGNMDGPNKIKRSTSADFESQFFERQATPPLVSEKTQKEF